MPWGRRQSSLRSQGHSSHNFSKPSLEALSREVERLVYEDIARMPDTEAERLLGSCLTPRGTMSSLDRARASTDD